MVLKLNRSRERKEFRTILEGDKRQNLPKSQLWRME